MRIHIADNHKILIEGVIAVLQAHDIEIEGYSTSGPKVIMWREQHQADVLLLDVSMPIMNGYEVLRHFKKKKIKQKTLMFSSYNDYDFINHSVRNGANGYILKEDSENLVKALTEIYKGGIYYSEKVMKKILDKNSETEDPVQKLESKFLLQDLIHNPDMELTDQEKEILRLLAHRRSSSEIQKDLNISGSTFRVHTLKMREKLNIKTTKDLIRYSKAIN